MFTQTPTIPERSVNDLARELGEVQLVDVREPDEFAAGHIDGARNIPLSQLGARLAELETERPLVLVCRSGNRSGYATMALQQAGYRNAENLDGGMVAWARAGLPIAR